VVLWALPASAASAPDPDRASPGAPPGAAVSTSAAADSVELVRLLDEFLAGAGGNDASVHERFWADDLIYTGSSGRRVTKADILRDVRSAPPPLPTDPITAYSAEEVQLRRLGDVALVAFRLVATTRAGNTERVARFHNTGTFAWRGGVWQAVGWQATRIPVAAAEAREQVQAAAAAFGRALSAADTTALAGLVTPEFQWNGAKAPLDRARFLADVAARKLRVAGWEPDPSGVGLHGDAAIVRGRVPGGRRFELTLVNDAGEWRATGAARR